MSAISEKIQRILRSRVQTDPSCLPASSEGQMSDNRIKLREILSDPPPPHEAEEGQHQPQVAVCLQALQISGDDERINHQLPQLLQHCLPG